MRDGRGTGYAARHRVLSTTRVRRFVEQETGSVVPWSQWPDSAPIRSGWVVVSPHGIGRTVGETRARTPVEKVSPYAYTDRGGITHLPFNEAVEIAQAFCAAEPAVVLASIEATEQEWAREAAQPGEKHMVSLLNEFRASWALLRQWAGQDAAITQRSASRKFSVSRDSYRMRSMHCKRLVSRRRARI